MKPSQSKYMPMVIKFIWLVQGAEYQVEDVCDVLAVKFKNNFVEQNCIYNKYNEDFAIMMDQSSGHWKMREGVSNINLMSVRFCGKQLKLRKIIIRDVGIYEWKLDAQV